MKIKGEETMKKILITPRAFAKSGREVIRELEKKGYSVIFNDTGKSYSPEVFLNLAKDADGIIIGVDKADRKDVYKRQVLHIHLSTYTEYSMI